jgi:hypothetical protein
MQFGTDSGTNCIIDVAGDRMMQKRTPAEPASSMQAVDVRL